MIREIVRRVMPDTTVHSWGRKTSTRLCTSVTLGITALEGRPGRNPPIKPRVRDVPLEDSARKQPQLLLHAPQESLVLISELPHQATVLTAHLASIVKEIQQQQLQINVPPLTSALAVPSIICLTQVACLQMLVDLNLVNTPPKVLLWRSNAPRGTTQLTLVLKCAPFVVQVISVTTLDYQHRRNVPKDTTVPAWNTSRSMRLHTEPSHVQWERTMT